MFEPQDAAAGRGLAAAGFADQAERLALADREADAVDRLHMGDHPRHQRALGHREVHLQVAHRDQLRRLRDAPFRFAPLFVAAAFHFGGRRAAFAAALGRPLCVPWS